MMLDPAALREAIYGFRAKGNVDLNVLLAAARALLARIEGGQKIWWCVEHNEHAATKSAGDQWCWRANFTTTLQPCRMVEADLHIPGEDNG